MEEEKNELNQTLAINSKLVKIIVILSIALIAVILAFAIFVHRSAKETVKDVGKVVKNTDILGAVDLVDPIGIAAFVSCYDYEDDEIDLDDFEDNYKKLEESYKKIKKEIKKGKYTIKVTNTKKVADCKKVTKVTCDVKIKYKDNEIKLEGIKVYTMKKGFKNYIVGVDPKSIYELGDQIEDQYDELEEMGEDLQDIVEDVQDIMY